MCFKHLKIEHDEDLVKAFEKSLSNSTSHCILVKNSASLPRLNLPITKKSVYLHVFLAGVYVSKFILIDILMFIERTF